ncbi:MAG TPA: methylamine utilization protein [Rhodanobacteraceae bacterium]
MPAVVLLMSMAVRAAAGELIVEIDDGHGQPAGDAVVTLRSESAQRVDARAPETKIVDQRDETFLPYVETFRPGDAVVFRNSDTTRHHVYSFAAAKSFEIVIAPGDSAPPVVLDRTGEIPVGCNIHDQMITHLYVSDAPWLARTKADGRAVFEDLAPGTYRVDVWHPQLRPGRPGPSKTIAIDDAPSSVSLTVSLLPDPRQSERARY